jgi:hypothetical protein
VTVQCIATIVLHEVMHEFDCAELVLRNLKAASTVDGELLLSVSSAVSIVKPCMVNIIRI